MKILAAVALVLLCGLGAAVLLYSCRSRRWRRIREQHEAETHKTLEDWARRRGI